MKAFEEQGGVPAPETTNEPPSLEQIHAMLADLDEWGRQLSRDAEEAYELEKKLYGSPLPTALFHATTPDRAAQIREKGLQPSRLSFEDRDAVCLSDTIGYARFCASKMQGVPPEDLVVLEVTTEGLPRDRIRSYLSLSNPIEPDEPLHEVHSEVPIQPDWLYELTPEEAAEIESTESEH